MSDLKQFDHYLTDDGPAALVIREYLVPVEGADGVLFPPTYAPAKDKSKFAGGYNIDGDPNGQNICLIDSVGAQANRIEPIFAKEKYAALIPQIVVEAGEKKVNILDAGHRAGDALVRCSALKEALQKAFKEVLRGDATALAKIAPTSLVFGVWDSRDTQAKLPRVIASVIRAENVREQKRSAVYIPPVEYINNQLIAEAVDQKSKDDYSIRGFLHALATHSPGGVIAHGGIRRDATLGLAALRLLTASDATKTLALRRYILGLALTAFTHNPSGYLRQGCLLVLDPDKPRVFVEVHPCGKREPCDITHAAALQYATAAALGFTVGVNQTVKFDTERAKRDIKGEGDVKATRKGAAKKSSASTAVTAESDPVEAQE